MLVDESTFYVLKKAIQEMGMLEIPAYGNSMYPFIQQGNICIFSPCTVSTIKKGDIILFYSSKGKLIAHRFVEKKITNKQTLFIFKGDTNLGYDQPIEEERIIGKLSYVQKNGYKLSPEQPISNLWGRAIIFFPILSEILRKHLNRKLNLQLK